MKKILAIDDNRDNLITIEATINNLLPNCKVFTALSGKEGLELAKKEKPDTILLDVIMPIMDGFEVCKSLKADEYTKHIPVIMITAVKTDAKNRAKGLNLGADAFVSKPIDSIELSAQINVMLRIKEAEDKLRVEKEQLDNLVTEKIKKIKYQSTILENVSDPIISMDMDHKIVSWNKSAEELYGYKQKEVVGKLVTDILKIEYIDQSGEEIYEELYSSGKFNNEVIHHKKDGTRLIVSASVSFMKDSDGNNIGLVSVIHDITLRKEALDICVKLSKAVYNSNEVIFLTDKEGIITFVNPEFIRMYGYSAEEIVGKVTPRILKSEVISDEEYEQFWKSLLSKDGVPAVAYSNKRKDGTLVDIEGSADPILNENNEIVGFLGIQRDIKERKIAEEKINEQAVFMKQNPAPVFSTDYEGIIIAVNPAAKNISKKIEIGKNTCLIFTNIKKSTLKNLGDDKQIQIEEKVGSAIYLFTIKKVVKTKQIYYFGSNITQLKKTGKDLIYALEKATESDRLKSAFLATISHELRTPLNAIIGFSDLVNEEISFEEIINYNKSINSSGKKLLSVVEDLFDITLIEAGEIKIIKEDVSLQSILINVFEIIKIYQHTTEKHNIDFKFINAHENNDLIIKTDASKLKQILVNLLNNAIKYTREGSVNYGYVLETDSNSSFLKFYIEDTGIGIPKDKQELIFEIFRQADGSHSREYGGTGIGLSIARKLTELLGGSIWLESEEGKGSTFYFTIPFKESEIIGNTSETIIAVKTKKNIQPRKKTVLVVEDDEGSFKFLKIVLEQSQMTVLWAKNGKEAIKLCKDNPLIGLVLMDINMPVMNGYEATKKIKRTRPNLPIIAQTAYTVFGDREKSIEAGCDDYISKPIKREELIEKIERLVSS